MSTNFTSKNIKNFNCKKCDFICFKRGDYNRHILTRKHKLATESTDFTQFYAQKKYSCDICDNEYKDRSGLWRHKNICFENKVIVNETVLTDKEIINILLQQNEKLMKVMENGVSNNTNCHNTNNAFNLNFFLNETCKNAMNINDFVSSIKLSVEDLENTGRRGYIEGISTIILKRLANLEQYDRPIHCSDCKREVMYIKTDNEWIKECEDKPILTKAIKTIANENIKQINVWKENNPECTEADSKKNNVYLKIVSNSMSGSTKEESDKNYEKIISNVSKQVIIDK